MQTFHSNLSRRRFLAGLTGVAAGGMLAGCGGNGNAGGGGDGKGLTFLNWAQVKGTPLEQAIQSYEKSSGAKVTVQPAVTQEYDTKMRTLLAGGSPPDVMRINDDFVRGFSEQGALLDLKPYLEKDGVDTAAFAKEAFEFPKQPDGSHTAWVLGYEPRLIFYNVDLFKQAGVPLPPTTWSPDSWSWADFADPRSSPTRRRSSTALWSTSTPATSRPSRSTTAVRPASTPPTARSSRCPAPRRSRRCSGRPT